MYRILKLQLGANANEFRVFTLGNWRLWGVGVVFGLRGLSHYYYYSYLHIVRLILMLTL